MRDSVGSRNAASHLNYTCNFARLCTYGKFLSEELCHMCASSHALHEGFFTLNYMGPYSDARPCSLAHALGKVYGRDHLSPPPFGNFLSLSLHHSNHSHASSFFHSWLIFVQLEVIAPVVHPILFSSKILFSSFSKGIISLIVFFISCSFHSILAVEQFYVTSSLVWNHKLEISPRNYFDWT